jgi:hypothetical protein
MTLPRLRIKLAYGPQYVIIVGRRSVAPIIEDQQQVGAVLLGR